MRQKGKKGIKNNPLIPFITLSDPLIGKMGALRLMGNASLDRYDRTMIPSPYLPYLPYLPPSIPSIPLVPFIL